MNILITNDDGISSQGILALEKSLSVKHTTFLIAPLKERSCTSMALTLFTGMRVERINDQHYVADGFPADCVNIGLYSGIFPKIDMVVSGINRGVNMGYDVHYSGTIGAAKHGALHGITSIAVSSVRIDPPDGYEREAHLVAEFIEEYSNKLDKASVYNMNFPESISGKGDLSELEWTHLGRRKYTENYIQKHIVGGISEFTLNGSQLDNYDDPGCDFDVFYQGKIPISTVLLDVTDHKELDRWKKQ
ncbi:5'/3'-nucleotidase SurE [Leptospira sp. GIMC2001]|uniref:5'/3'-nucleotidase SurE n=1 Tax=Leptospira sp. GIMC2001 TaxID=1513297 RepID=UPI00234B4390|nr:5'/3'-nucleotidase SurE [Leptospira sp. GIMC2001]WCL50337.1 5'/3'-nucleotidase SurE [Leptospira sp. GIMC2001]